MYKTGDVVVYGAEGLCKVEEITEKNFGKEVIEYYVLKQINGNNSVTYVPVHNEKSVSKMRPVMTKDEINKLIESLSEEDTMWIESDRERQKYFRDILIFGDSRDLIKLTKTLYLHQKEQQSKGKKLHISDEHFLKEAERMIFGEIAYVMDIPYGKVLTYIVENVQEK